MWGAGAELLSSFLLDSVHGMLLMLVLLYCLHVRPAGTPWLAMAGL
jgi:hypothetical protein